VRDAGLQGTTDGAERAAWRRSFAALLAAVACWEVFLRVDSSILAASTKAWLFPLLAIVLVLDGLVVGDVLGAAAIAFVGAPVQWQGYDNC
jgi:hypothetical protein